ncbi:hypothetical protein LI90_2442 [Carbonactinospora thermoautotrophica]|uniref:DUF3800 domain-containing protein n=1 Tax=Carbonactinospora thermoautotrophica TaxID=1469144 RepID=A0A132MUD9_9ACTN|nr:DUF3800 domain-containing protein [Carbonactinospora thermoautotrophica]KWX01414.1 hypothetical protein LI90_2442 [Carbonactinospora thermoautotrophica]
MYFCYVDEAGCGELLTPSRPASTPVFCIVGVIVEDRRLKKLVWDFLALKKEFEPSLTARANLSDVVRHEVKGANIRADIRSTSRRRRRRALRILDSTLQLLQANDCRLIGRVWVKMEDVPMDETAVYTSSVSAMCEYFHHFLESREQSGALILDSRTNKQNAANVHCITTRKFRTGGDPYRRLVESPLFGLSDTHVVLQISDLLASAVVFPLACMAYCSDLTWNTHSIHAYHELKGGFAERVAALQYRFPHPETGKWSGGVVVSDRRMGRSGKLLFQ